MSLKFIDEAEIQGKKVVARFDFNVPIKNGVITDTTRIDSALQTIRYIADHGASKIVMMSHLGRPKGRSMDASLGPVATYLAEQLKQDVILTESCVDAGVKGLLALPKTRFVMLENVRFHPEEEKNDMEFARKLSEYGDIYVNDAFGSAHRKHSSTYAINAFFKEKAYGGFLLKQEIQALSRITENPGKPFVAVVGGAKVADKIKTIERLLSSVDTMCIGGAMAYPFLKSQGHEIGKSLCSSDDVELATRILKQSGAKILLPLDHVISDKMDGMASSCPQIDIPADKMGLDIGPQTLLQFRNVLLKAKTVLWNGPMGMFENKEFAKGTFQVAAILAESQAFTLVGGGDSVSAVNKSGLSEKMSHISTGGGASLEFIEEGTLPGIQALRFGVN